MADVESVARPGVGAGARNVPAPPGGGAPPVDALALFRGAAERLPWLVLGMVGAAVAVLWWRVWASDWQLVGDEAVIVLRSTDVLGPDTPLLGMPSAVSSWTTEADPFHPGPAVYWVLAPFTAVLGAGVAGALAATAALAIGSVAVLLRTTTRLIGPAWAPMAGAAAVVLLTLDREPWRPLNPLMAVLPALVVCVLTWSVVAGDGRSWPWLAGFSAFTLQADLSYLLTTGTLLLAALLVTAVRFLRTEPGGHAPLTTGQLGATVAVAALAWALPVVEAVGGESNLDEMAKTAGAGVATVGVAEAARATWPLLLSGAALAVLALVGRRTGRAVRWSLVATAALAGGAAFLSIASTPAAVGVGDVYYRLPGVVATVFVASAAVVVGVELMPPRTRPDLSVVVLASLCLTVMPVRLATWAAGTSTDGVWLSAAHRSIEELADQLQEELQPGSYELRTLGGPEAIGLTHGLRLAMADAGADLRVEQGDARYVGPNRLADGDEDGVLYLTFGDAPPAESVRLVARWTPDRPPLPTDPVTREAVTFTSGGYWVGGVVAGTGEDRDMVSTLDEAGLMATGETLLADPRRASELSDAAFAELVRRGLVRSAEDGGPLGTDDLELAQLEVVSVWLDEADRG